MLILLPRAAVVVLLLLLVPQLLVMPPATMATAGAPEVENDRLPVLLVRRRTALAPVDVAKAANCLVGRSTEVSMTCACLWPDLLMMVAVRKVRMIFWSAARKGRGKQGWLGVQGVPV